MSKRLSWGSNSCRAYESLGKQDHVILHRSTLHSILTTSLGTRLSKEHSEVILGQLNNGGANKSPMQILCVARHVTATLHGRQNYLDLQHPAESSNRKYTRRHHSGMQQRGTLAAEPLRGWAGESHVSTLSPTLPSIALRSGVAPRMSRRTMWQRESTTCKWLSKLNITVLPTSLHVRWLLQSRRLMGERSPL